MRIISGTFRSRTLIAPPGMATRPSSDRLRETLFNVIAPQVPNSRFIDLYAGSGAIGIEALSRGASHVFFAEKAAKATAAIRANLKSLDIKSGITIEPGGTATLLKRLSTGNGEFNLIFLDPPWDAAAEYTRTLTTLGSEEWSNALADDALIIAEHARKQDLPERFHRLARTRTLLQGDAALSFYRVQPELPNVV